MMFFDWKIRKEILIEFFSEEFLQFVGYDLRVGGEVYVNGKIFDVKDLGGVIIFLKIYVLVLIFERIKFLDDVMGDMKFRSSLVREGLIGFFVWVDFGWDGNFILVLFNVFNEFVEFKYGECFVQIVFIWLEGFVKNFYCGNYQGSKYLVFLKRKW